MKVTLIHNPSAGESGLDREHLERLVRSAGHEPLYQNCRESQWTDVLHEKADLVAVAGGDGTVTRVAKALAGRGVPMGVLPAGTANNLARTLGVFEVPYRELIAAWEGGRRVRFDVGLAKGPWGELRFIEGVGLGLFAWTLPQAEAHPTLNSLDVAEAKVAYAIQMLRERLDHYPVMTVSASIDGEDVSGKYLLFEAMNTHYIGPNLFLAPKADLDDGCVDLIMVTEAERERLGEYLSSWQKGWHRPPEFTCRRGRRLEVEWLGFETHIDDELWPKEDQDVRPLQGDIEITNPGDLVEFVVPPEKPSVAERARDG